MKIASLKRDYLTQLKRPKPKRYKGRKSDNWDNFEKRYNNMWSINERIARYNLRLQKASEKLVRDNKYKTFYKLLDKVKVMKNSNIDTLFEKKVAEVKKDFIDTYFDGSSVDAMPDMEVINSLDWDSLDFSTKDNKRESFKNMLAKNPTFDAQVTEREKAIDAIKKEESKKQARLNAEKVKEQAQQISEQEKQISEQAQINAQLQAQLQAMQAQLQAMQAQAKSESKQASKKTSKRASK